MPYCEIPNSNEDVRIHYRLVGNGPTKVLFVHGFATSKGGWSFQTKFFRSQPQLLSEFQICTLDNRGVGKSYTPNTHYAALKTTTALMASDLLVLVRHLGWVDGNEKENVSERSKEIDNPPRIIDEESRIVNEKEKKKFHLVGISMGGMICLQFAVRNYDLLSSLTLINTHAGGWRAITPYQGWVTIGNWTLYRFFRNSMESKLHCTMMLQYGHSVGKTEEKWKQLIKHIRVRTLHIEKQALKGLLSHIAAVFSHYVPLKKLEELRDSGLPIMVCVGTKDLLVRPSNSFWLRSVLRAQLHIFQGEGHGLIGEVSEKFNDILIQHLRNAEKGVRYNIPAKYFHKSMDITACSLQKLFWRNGYYMSFMFVIILFSVAYVFITFKLWIWFRRNSFRTLLSTSTLSSSPSPSPFSHQRIPFLARLILSTHMQQIASSPSSSSDIQVKKILMWPILFGKYFYSRITR